MSLAVTVDERCFKKKLMLELLSKIQKNVEKMYK